MGGMGSGSRYQWWRTSAKTTVEACKSIDATYWKREGILRAGVHLSCTQRCLCVPGAVVLFATGSGILPEPEHASSLPRPRSARPGRRSGFRIPVAITAAVYAECVKVPASVVCQDEAGRLFDLL